MKNKIVMNLQLFAASKTGVSPCYENQFQIDTAASGGTVSLKNIADCGANSGQTGKDGWDL